MEFRPYLKTCLEKKEKQLTQQAARFAKIQTRIITLNLCKKSFNELFCVCSCLRGPYNMQGKFFHKNFSSGDKLHFFLRIRCKFHVVCVLIIYCFSFDISILLNG